MVLLLPAGGLIWLANDKQWVRGAIERVVSTASGRPFTIEGEFDYDLGRFVEVRASRIRWRDPGSETSPDLLEVERFSVTFDVWSLIERPIRITDTRASRATIWFDWSGQGGLNWRFRPPATSASDRPAPRHPLPLVIERAALEDVSIRFLHPALTDQLEVRVTEAHHVEDEAHRLIVTGEAVLQGQTLALDARIGPFPELAVAGAVDFDLSVAGALASLKAAGSVAALASLQDLKLAAEIEAQNSKDLAEQLKLPLHTTGEVRLRADIDSLGNGIRASGGGVFGAYQVDARVLADNLRSLQGLQAAVDSTGPSARDIAAIAGVSGLPDAPYELQVRVQQTAHGLELQSLRLDTAGLSIDGSGFARSLHEPRDLDLTLTAKGSDAAVVTALFGLDAPLKRLPFQLRAAVVGHGPGEHDEVDAQLQLGDAAVKLAGSISKASDFSGSRLELTLDTPDTSQLAGVLGIAAPVTARLQLHGTAVVTTEQIRVENLAGSLDRTELSGSATVARGPGPPVLGLDVQAKSQDLAAAVGPLLPDTARRFLPDLPFTAAAELHLAQGKLQIASARATVGDNSVDFRGLLDTAQAGMNLAGDLSARGEDLAELLRGLELGDIPVKAFSLDTRLRLSPDAIRLEAIDFTAARARVGGVIGLTGKGYSRVEFDLSGSGDDLGALIPENPHYTPPLVPFTLVTRGVLNPAAIGFDRLEARLGASRLALSGEFQFKPKLSARRVRLEATGERLSDLGTLRALQLSDRPFKLVASLQGDASEQLIEDLSFESGDNNLSGRFRYIDQARPLLEVAVTSSRLNLDELRVPDPPDDEPEAEVGHAERFFSDKPLPFDLLDRLDADMSVRIDDLVSHERHWRDLVVEAVARQGVLQVHKAQVAAANGELKGRGMLEPAAEGRKLSMEITAANAMLASQQMTQRELDRLPRYAIDARLSAAGSSPHELAASLNGFIWMIGGEGEGRRSELEPLFGDFLTQLLSAINPFSTDETLSRTDCAGVYLEIVDGKLETSPAIVFQTDKVVAYAVGEIDLASERIDLTFQTASRQGVGLSISDAVNPFTKLTGTLRDPTIDIDPSGALVEGGAALASGGLTILFKSLRNSWFRSSRICEKTATDAAEIRRNRDPGNVPDLDTLRAGTRASPSVDSTAPEPNAAGAGSTARETSE